MADAAVSTLKPKWQLILGLLPSMNASIISVVSVLLGAVGMYVAQPRLLPVAKVEVPPTAVPYDRILKIEGDLKLIADWVAAQQPKTPARPAAAKK